MTTKDTILSSGYKVGTYLNLDGGVWKIVAKKTCLSKYPGGVGCSEYTVQFVQSGRLPPKRLREMSGFQPGKK